MFKRLDQDGNGDLTEVANMFMHSGDLLLSQNIKIINCQAPGPGPGPCLVLTWS